MNGMRPALWAALCGLLVSLIQPLALAQSPRNKSIAEAAIEANSRRNQPAPPTGSGYSPGHSHYHRPSYGYGGYGPAYGYGYGYGYGYSGTYFGTNGLNYGFGYSTLYPGGTVYPGANVIRCSRCGFYPCRCGNPYGTIIYPPRYVPAYQYGFAVTPSMVPTPTYDPLYVPPNYTPLPGLPLSNPVIAARPPANANGDILPDLVIPAVPRRAEFNRISERAAKIRNTSEATRDRADADIDAGDRLFTDGQYVKAQTRYSEAVRTAPDYPRARFRLAHAYVTTNRMTNALEEYLLGLELSGVNDQFGFKLSQLYGDAPQRLESQLEFLSDQALKHPEDGALLMLIGLTLHSDHQKLRARPFFEQASRMPGEWQPYARRFLSP